jgi:hypothetical protein
MENMMEQKKIKKLIKNNIQNCFDCPYLEHDGHYDKCQDSGHDCKLSGKRIINDWNWDNTNNPKRLNKKMRGIPIPEWCELDDDKIKKQL